MAYPNRQEVTLYDNITPVTVASSTDATPIVVTTSTNHGYTTGQRVLIYGHTTNVAANGIYIATVLSPTTFSLGDEITGASIVGSGAGAGAAGITVPAPPVMLAIDFRNIVLQINTSGTATVTLKAVGSLGMSASFAKAPRNAYPNIGGTLGPSDPYSFLQIINLDSGTALAGSTGLVVAGTDVNNQFEINTNAQRYVTMIPTSWSAGAITVRAVVTTNA